VTSESHAHRLAKTLFAGWLRDSASSVGRDGYAGFAGIGWRVNRGPPTWGIWEEYPFCDLSGIVWDEIDDRWLCQPPSYDQLIAMGRPPFAIVDVAVQHKGMIAYAVEIMHKHECDEKKLTILRSCVNSILEVPAYWILGQVGTPTQIPEEFFVKG